MTGRIFPSSAAAVESSAEPFAGRAVLELGADGEDRGHDDEYEHHHGHEARREVIAVVDVGIEQHVLVEAHGLHLGHGLPLGEPLFGEDLDLDAGGEHGDGRLDVLGEESVDGDVGPRYVGFDVGLAVAEDVLLEESRYLHDGRNTPFAHEPFALVHGLDAVGDQSRGGLPDHLGDLARERRMVLVEDRDGDVARHALVEQHREEDERKHRQHEQQHEVHRLVSQSVEFALERGVRIAQKAHASTS